MLTLPIMNVHDPTTWNAIASHPEFQGSEFEPSWYEGDSDADLSMLRSVATEILSSWPGCACELIVLDDCTMFVDVRTQGAVVCSIYPIDDIDGERGYFLDLEGIDEEIRLKSANEVVGILTDCMGR